MPEERQRIVLETWSDDRLVEGVLHRLSELARHGAVRTDDAAEREALTAHLLPPMLVAGFVTVTMVSVVLAGLFVGLIG